VKPPSVGATILKVLAAIAVFVVVGAVLDVSPYPGSTAVR